MLKLPIEFVAVATGSATVAAGQLDWLGNVGQFIGGLSALVMLLIAWRRGRQDKK